MKFDSHEDALLFCICNLFVMQISNIILEIYSIVQSISPVNLPVHMTRWFIAFIAYNINDIQINVKDFRSINQNQKHHFLTISVILRKTRPEIYENVKLKG